MSVERNRWLLLVAGLAAGLLLGFWLSARSQQAHTGSLLPLSPELAAAPLAAHLDSAQVPTTTVYLPSISRDFPPPPPVFGVHMFAVTDTGGLSQVVEAGVHWVRLHTFDWDQIEPLRTEPPTYHWEAVDEDSLRNAAASGLEVIAVVRFAPPWAQQYAGVFCGPIRPDRLDEFAQFLAAAVGRYSAPEFRVRYWELGNEPDVDPSLVGARPAFGCWGDVDDAYYGGGAYAGMLQAAYPAIKAADPRAIVLHGGLLLDCDPRVPGACSGPHGDKPLAFLEGVLRGGGGPFFDLLSFHTYSYFDGLQGVGYMTSYNWPGSVTGIPEKTSFLREVLSAQGFGDKPLINSEAALLCYEGSEDCRQTQAMYVPRAYAETLALALEGTVYYAIINETWWYSGLLLPDLTPKPAYEAYVVAASFLADAKYEGVATGYPPGIEGFAFVQRDSGARVDVLWSADGSVVQADLPPDALAYDHFGTLLASSGQISVNYSPVYVLTPGSGAVPRPHP